jgi:hypothetical protein
MTMSLDPELRVLNEEALTSLREAWDNHKLTIIVGAGASHQSGLPLWDELLEKLLLRWVGKHYRGKFSCEIREHFARELSQQSPIVFAHFLQSRLTEKAFINLIHHSMYGDLPCAPEPGPIMRAIGRLGPKLKSVVTFNFDDLVETALRLDGSTCTSVWTASKLSKIKGVPVYHPHGFLPFHRQQDEAYKVLLAEADYHTLYANAHSWSNIVFSTALLESVCLFVTTSISDPNVRRMLDVAHREVPDDFDYFLWHTPHKSQLSKADAVVQRAYSKVFCDAHRKLGLKPVWFFKRNSTDPTDRYSDVPAILDAIRE